MYKKITPVTIVSAFFLLLTQKTALAICPICTVAVGAGVGLAKWLGIDDTITGTWIGGLTVSMTLWTINWLRGKKIKFKGLEITTAVGYYLLIVLPLYYSGTIGHPFNQLWGIDKLLLGIITGSIVFVLANNYYNFLKQKNNNHAYFPFQKVVMPVAGLAIMSAIFYLIIR